MKTINENCEKKIKDLCKSENLVFLTKSANREPTLYFSSGKIIGRIRQEHHDGRKISLFEENRFRIFFTGDDEVEKILDEKKANLPKLATFDKRISILPREDWKVLEYSTKNKAPDGEVKTNKHFSEGVIKIKEVDGITQMNIDKMIADISTKECHPKR